MNDIQNLMRQRDLQTQITQCIANRGLTMLNKDFSTIKKFDKMIEKYRNELEKLPSIQPVNDTSMPYTGAYSEYSRGATSRQVVISKNSRYTDFDNEIESYIED